MKPEVHSETIQLAGTEISLETGRIARQASGAVILRHADDVILATVVVAPGREGLDFFPLTVEYREKMAAAGRIPGNFLRREGRISDHEVLQCRLIDRSIRSLFPKHYRAEVQVQVQALSADPNSDLTSLGIVAACAALHLSPAPATGPMAGLRVSEKPGGGFTPFATLEAREQAELDFVVSGGPNGLVMVEGGANEADEESCLAALEQAQEWIGKLSKAIDSLRHKAGKDKQQVPSPEQLPVLPAEIESELREALAISNKAARNQAVDSVRAILLEASEPEQTPALRKAFDKARSEIVRDAILSGRPRLDGRSASDIRPIWSEVSWLPRAHGSAIFTRGETQALCNLTLGTAEDAQRIESLAGMRDEHFLLHYNFPPYSVGEARPLRGPGRREIGHGFLARRGLQPLLPSFEDFPYTIRIESEITESNGSSSMATACGGCLALMDGGVPLRRPVAGIAMGLVTDGERTVVLSDILGDEDHLGDMDFKVVGTSVGVTALQLDNKVGGLSREQLGMALDQARIGRLHILGEMAKTLDKPRAQVAARAPQVLKTAIMPESVGVLIGPRGQTIKGIAAATGAKVNVDDDGLVRIYAAEQDTAQRALKMVNKVAGVVKRGGYYTGTVVTVKDFGMFVRINEVVEGLVSKGDMLDRGEDDDKRFERGEAIVVRVLGADDRGRLQLSRRAALGVDEALIEF